MINIADLIIDTDGKKLTTPEYQKVANDAAAGIDYVLCGMKPIGSLMFWAAGNTDYDGEMGKADMQNLGMLIEANAKFLERMLEVESNALFNLKEGKSDASEK